MAEAVKSEILIITGMSGAGKSTCVDVLEDMGYFCVDNLPPNLFPKLIEGITVSRGGVEKIAIVVDVRSGEFFYLLEDALAQLRSAGIVYRIIYFEASNEVLLRRFKSTRRRHPLAEEGRSMLDNISQERRLLQNLRSIADIVLDTTDMDAKQFAKEMTEIVAGRKEAAMLISVLSFGYKYGLPMDADLIFDVRFLPNPFYIEELRPLNGLDEKVRSYVMDNEISAHFMQKAVEMLEFLLPNYIAEGKKYLTIGIGCTGGQHRSVAIAEALANILKEKLYFVTHYHRDISKAPHNAVFIND